MDAILARAAKGDFQMLHAAMLFEVISSAMSEKLADFHGMGFSFDREDLNQILWIFPGAGSKKYKAIDAEFLANYTPPYVKQSELVIFSKKLIRFLRENKIANNPLWEVPLRFRFHLITAVIVIRLFRKKHRLKKTTLLLREPDAGTIEAPLKGMFYRHEHKNEKPLVEVGDVIEKDQPFFVIEVQKNFLLYHAENRMEILEIVAQNATVVEAGNTLFRVKILPDEEEEY